VRKQRPTVLFCNNAASRYGAETSLLEMVGALRGVDPIVLLPNPGPVSDCLEKQRTRVLIEDLIPRNIFESWHSIARLTRIIRDNGVDLLHLNKAYSYQPLFLLVARLASWRTGIPLVVHVRGAVVRSRFHQVLLRVSDTVICVSERTKDEVFGQRSALPLTGPPKHVTVVYNGRSFDAYRFSRHLRTEMRRRFHLEDDDFVVATIGYIDPLKGQDRFLALARSLLNDGVRIKFLIVGDLAKERNRPYLEMLQREISEPVLSTSVILTGFVDCRDILSAIDVVVSLSETEGLPGVLIEAMAAERVVVANAVGGIPEILGDHRSGCLVGAGDVARVKQILLWLASNPELRQAMGTRACAHVHLRFSADGNAAQIAGIYDRLLPRPLREPQLGQAGFERA
jgi:glycosyltransferase involved in cell wall biosynthesis